MGEKMTPRGALPSPPWAPRRREGYFKKPMTPVSSLKGPHVRSCPPYAATKARGLLLTAKTISVTAEIEAFQEFLKLEIILSSSFYPISERSG